jgi:hypothetical protein
MALRSLPAQHHAAALRQAEGDRGEIQNGVVEVHVPKAAEVVRRKIELKVRGEGSTIDAEQAT